MSEAEHIQKEAGLLGAMKAALPKRDNKQKLLALMPRNYISSFPVLELRDSSTPATRA